MPNPSQEFEVNDLRQRLLVAQNTRRPFLHTLNQLRIQTIHQSTNLTNLRLQIHQCESDLNRASYNRHRSYTSNQFFQYKARQLREMKQERELCSDKFEEMKRRVESMNGVIQCHDRAISELERLINCAKA